jgi:hypothetical protein
VPRRCGWAPAAPRPVVRSQRPFDWRSPLNGGPRRSQWRTTASHTTHDFFDIMINYTPSTAKNHMRRTLWALLNPMPSSTEIDELWQYFESRCAYCGMRLDRRARGGHLDHIVSSSAGGTNEIYNRVLSCPKCNGDDKRDEPWQEFLKRTVSDSGLLKTRHAIISNWIARSTRTTLNEEMCEEARRIVEASLLAYDRSVAAIRKLRNGGA